MKKIICEMCGGNELLKEDGRYICQSCGTQYTVEEAKKMLVEVSGTVDVSGSTIKVDNSLLVQRSLQNARRAKQKEDWEECEKYYNLVEQNDPNNIEAIFYSAYSKARFSLVDSDIYKRQAVFKVLQNCISIIDDNFKLIKEDEQYDTIEQISVDIFSLINSNYVYTQYQNGWIFSDNKNETITLFNGIEWEFINTLNNIAEEIFKTENTNERKKHTLSYYKLAIKHCDHLLTFGHLSNQNDVKQMQKCFQDKVTLLEPSSTPSNTTTFVTSQGELNTFQKIIEKVQKHFYKIRNYFQKLTRTKLGIALIALLLIVLLVITVAAIVAIINLLL